MIKWNESEKRFEVDPDDAIGRVYSKMYEPWRLPNAVWLINQDITTALDLLPKESN